jgi:hypothetical protein
MTVSVLQAIEYSVLTVGAKLLMVFNAKSQQIISGGIFGFYHVHRWLSPWHHPIVGAKK